MKRLFLILCVLCVCSIAHADNLIQRVSIEPLASGVSFNSVTTLYKDWVTAPSVELIGRKEMLILNTSTTENLYITGVSGSSATGTIYPRESAMFKAASNLHLYASGNSVVFQVWEIR